MKKEWVFFVFGILILFELWFVSAADIYNCNDLQSMSLSGNHRLMNDINCNANTGFTPIGTNTNKFTGSLDGRGYKIHGLIINQPSIDYVGLVGYLAAGAKIENVVLVFNISYGKARTGSLVGHNAGIINNCKVFMGSPYSGINGVKGWSMVGGLVGYNEGDIKNCSVNIKVDYTTGGGYYIGGLIGYLGTALGSAVRYSNAKGNVNGEVAVGGLVGYMVASGIIANSYATGTVMGIWDAGGLVGESYGSITNSYATGNVIVTSGTAGGLLGHIFDSSPANIVNCYAIGSVSGPSGVKGLIGRSNTACSSSYKTINSYYPDTSPIDNCGISQAGSPSAFYSNNHAVYTANVPYWDFTYTWTIDNGIRLPYLKSEKYCGDGFCRSDENSYDCPIDCGYPPSVLSFIPPTRPNEDVTGERFYKFNVSIMNPYLKNVKLNWNGTNFTIYNESLLLMYNFDNRAELGEGSSIVKDFSKYGNNGSVYGATWTSNGKYNGAYSFDGTFSNYINIPSFGNLQGDYTVSAWVKRNDASSCIILSKGGDVSGEKDYHKNIEFRIENNKIKFWFGNTGASNYGVNLLSNTIQSYNIEYFLTVVKSGSNINLYLNGNLDGSAVASSSPYQTSSPLKIASYKWDGNWYTGCNGYIDELRIWNRSLSAREINESYMSNLYRSNWTRWYLYVNQSANATDKELDYGKYFYETFSSNLAGQESTTGSRNITIIPSGVAQVFWANMIGTAITNADLKDRVKLIARGSDFTGELNYTLWKDGFWFFDKRITSQTSETGFITWVANESGNYFFKVKRVEDPDSAFVQSGNLAVSGTENNFALDANITSLQDGDIYLSSDLILFNQSTYDKDDFFDYVWNLGEGIIKSGSSETYNNYNFTFNSYTSSGQKNINLGVADERGAKDSDEKSIFVINPNVIANYTFAHITKPRFGESANGPFVIFNATKSFAIEVNSSKNLTCLGGDCPSTTTMGTLIYDSYNLRGNYDNINFSWTFDDGDKYNIKGINGVNFTKIFGKSGQHNAQLTVIIPNANSLIETSFNLNFINYCEADGLKYWNISGSSLDTLTGTNPLGCGGLNGIPGGDDDCCPANYGCTITGCKLNTTIQKLCNNVSFCSDYKDAVNCSLDLCRVGSDSACGGIIQTGANCMDDFFVKINCSCKYNTASNKCELNSQVRGSIFQTNNELIYYCSTTTNHGDCNMQSGFMRVQMNSTLTGAPLGCNLNESLCSTEQGSVVCGAARVKLPFFTFFNFIFSLILIVGIYIVLGLNGKLN